jgi:hypothetical protein
MLSASLGPIQRKNTSHQRRRHRSENQRLRSGANLARVTSVPRSECTLRVVFSLDAQGWNVIARSTSTSNDIESHRLSPAFNGSTKVFSFPRTRSLRRCRSVGNVALDKSTDTDNSEETLLPLFLRQNSAVCWTNRALSPAPRPDDFPTALSTRIAPDVALPPLDDD